MIGVNKSVSDILVLYFEIEQTLTLLIVFRLLCMSVDELRIPHCSARSE